MLIQNLVQCSLILRLSQYVYLNKKDNNNIRIVTYTFLKSSFKLFGAKRCAQVRFLGNSKNNISSKE